MLLFGISFGVYYYISFGIIYSVQIKLLKFSMSAGYCRTSYEEFGQILWHVYVFLFVILSLLMYLRLVDTMISDNSVSLELIDISML